MHVFVRARDRALAAISRQGRGARRRVAVFAAVGATIALFAAPAMGILGGSPSKFESADGNMLVGTAGNTDWNCFTTLAGINVGNTPCGTSGKFNGASSNAFTVADVNAGTANDLSWKAGQKQDTSCPSLTTSKDAAKDTFTNVSSYVETALNNGAAGDTYLYGATIRSAANGNSSENVELNQKAANSSCSLPRTAGDKLIAIDYVGSGPQFSVLTWIDSSNPGAGQTSANTGKCYVSSDPMPCWGATVASASAGSGTPVEGASNATSIAGSDNGISAASLATGQFAEFGADLTALGVLSTTGCQGFAQAVWESRSSGSSFVSNPEDVEIEQHTVTNCQPVTISVLKQDNGNPPQALAGAVFGLYAGGSVTGTPIATCTTGDGQNGTTLGQCTFGRFTGTGSYAYTVHEQSPPPGYSAASADQTCSGTFGTTARTCTLTFSDSPVAGAIAVQKNDGAGHALAGAVFTLYTSSNTPVTDGSGNPVRCMSSAGAMTDANGSCSFQNVALGSYSVVETTTPSGYQTAPAQQVTVGTGSTGGSGQTVALTFTDPAAPATIGVVKQDTSGTLLGGAVFQLFAGAGTSGTPLSTCTTGDGTAGTTLGACTFSPSLTGSGAVAYTIHEKTAPVGYIAAPDQTFNVVYGNSPQNVTKTFTDTPAPGTIVITKRDDAGNALAGATFTLYGESGSEPSGDSATSPDADDHLFTDTLGTTRTCTTDATGSCSLPNVPVGAYTVFETGTPAGYQTAAAQDVTIAFGASPGAGDTESLSFTDQRLHKVIVLVCHEGTNTLDQSQVTFDGSAPGITGATLSTPDTGSLPGTISEADLCKLGGAVLSDQPEGPLANGVQLNIQ